MITIPIKPLSVNEAWQGRRFKTEKYKTYCNNAQWLLPKHITIPDGRLKITFIFYVSNARSDWDNPIKPIQDIIFKRYGIDDSRIFCGAVVKVIVKKGHEKIEFKIEEYSDGDKCDSGKS